MTTTPTPHGCFFRENFVRPAIARDVLRHVLPGELLADVDLERLVISPDTFVTEALRKIYSDLIYQIPYRDRVVPRSASKGQDPATHIPTGALPWPETLARARALP